MKYLYTILLVFVFSGCAVSSVRYDCDLDETKKEKQYFEHHECTYLIGPFLVWDELVIDDVVEKTIQKANENGRYGDKLINVEIKEGGYTMLLFSKLCLYVSGNVVYSNSFDE